MPLPAVLMGAGTFLQMFGNFSANMAQGAAELESAKLLEEQARVAELQKFRTMDLVRRKYSEAYGQQVSGYAGGGVDVGSGSAADVVGRTLADGIMELEAVEKDMDIQIRLARARSRRQEQMGEQLMSPGYNLLQAGTTLLTNYTSSEGFGSWDRNPAGGNPFVSKYE